MSRCRPSARLFALVLLYAGALHSSAEGTPAYSAQLSGVDEYRLALEAQVVRTKSASERAWQNMRRTLHAFKAEARAAARAWRSALSDAKARLSRVTREAATTFAAWKALGARAYANLRANAADTLEHLAAWMRPPAQPQDFNRRGGTPI
jgi:hypothetical protein